MTLKEYLAANGMRANHFAKLLGVPAQTMHGYIHQRRTPDIAMALNIERLTKGDVKPKDWLPPEKPNLLPQQAAE